MKREVVVTCIIILLLVGVNVSGTFVKETKESLNTVFDGNTLYVGGSGPNNYTTIQGAIDDAVDGDTVFVYDDSSPYNENIIVNKTINLIGEGKNSTIIDSCNNGYVITITSDLVNISNFYLRGDDGIHIKSSFNEITYNIMNFENACIFDHSWDEFEYNVISNNEFIHNDYYGIDDTVDCTVHLHRFNHNTITKNKFFSYYDTGLDISGDYNIISENTFYNSSYYDSSETRFAVIKIMGDYNILSNNTILSGYLENDESYIGISLRIYKRYNIISGNYISGCSEYGIYIDEGWHNNIIKNNIIDCNFGITLIDSNDNIISNNKIINCYSGISLTESNRNNISYNLIQNVRIGIEIIYVSNQNIIDHNNFLDNDRNAWFAGYSFDNYWNRNYWKEPRYIPYPIFGNIRISIFWFIFLVKIFNTYPPLIPTFVVFDWFPAKEPYDMEV